MDYPSENLAFTVDTSGYSAILPPLSGEPPLQDQVRAQFFAGVRRRDIPGQTMSNVFAQVDRFRGAVYVAVKSVMDGLSGATVKMLQRSPQRKGISSASEVYSDEWEPLPYYHAANQLFENVNSVQPFDLFLAEYVMSQCLTGQAFMYAVPGKKWGKPCELWNIPTPYIQPAYLLSKDYPRGSWWVQLPQPMTFGIPNTGSIVLDNKWVVHQRDPHPRWYWDGYSPVQAGALELDSLDEINYARKNAMERGATVDTIVSVAGASERELIALKAKWDANFTNQSRGEKIAFTPGEGVKAEAVGLAPKEMSFPEGYEQLTNFVLSLFKVPAAVAGATDVGGYAQLYASIMQFHELNLTPRAKSIGEYWTKHLIRPHWGNDIKLVLELPSVQSQEDRRADYRDDMDILTVNQRNKMHHRPPIGPEGDVPTSIWLGRQNNQLQLELQQKQMEMQMQMAAQQQAAQQSQVPGGGESGQPPEQPQAQPEGDGEPPVEGDEQQAQGEDGGDFRSALIEEVVKSLGVDPSQLPQTEKGFLADDVCASTQIDLTDDLRRHIEDLGNRILPDDLDVKGTEKDPHVTVLYGIHDHAIRPGIWRKTIRRITAKHPEFKLSTGQLKAFRAIHTGKPFDVLYLDINGPQLNRLQSEFRDYVPSFNDHPIYTPHATVAYVKPGMADKYIAAFGQQPIHTQRCHEVLFSDCMRNKTRLKLMGQVTKKGFTPDEVDDLFSKGLIDPKKPKGDRAIVPLAPKGQGSGITPRIDSVERGISEQEQGPVAVPNRPQGMGQKRGEGRQYRTSSSDSLGSSAARSSEPIPDYIKKNNDDLVRAALDRERPEPGLPSLPPPKVEVAGFSTNRPETKPTPIALPEGRKDQGFNFPAPEKVPVTNSQPKEVQPKQSAAVHPLLDFSLDSMEGNNDYQAVPSSDKTSGRSKEQLGAIAAALEERGDPKAQHFRDEQDAVTRREFELRNAKEPIKESVRENKPDETIVKDKSVKPEIHGWSLPDESDVQPESSNKETVSRPNSDLDSAFNDEPKSADGQKLGFEDVKSNWDKYQSGRKSGVNTDDDTRNILDQVQGLSPQDRESLAKHIGINPSELEAGLTKQRQKMDALKQSSTPKDNTKEEIPTVDIDPSGSGGGKKPPTDNTNSAGFDEDNGEGESVPSLHDFVRQNPNLNPEEAAKQYNDSYGNSSSRNGGDASGQSGDGDNKAKDKMADVGSGSNAYVTQFANGTRVRIHANSLEEAHQVAIDLAKHSNVRGMGKYHILGVDNDSGSNKNTKNTQQRPPEPPQAPRGTEKAASQAKRRLGSRPVVDRLLGIMGPDGFSQLKDWKDWGKFISGAVVMGVARRHALGMFSAKSLILHVLGAYAHHLFTKATEDRDAVEPAEKPPEDLGFKEAHANDVPQNVKKPIVTGNKNSAGGIPADDLFDTKKMKSKSLQTYIESMIEDTLG